MRGLVSADAVVVSEEVGVGEEVVVGAEEEDVGAC